MWYDTRQYCTAFNANDKSACNKKVPDDEIDYKAYAYQKISKKGKSIKFKWVGDLISKRDEAEGDEGLQD